MLAEPICANQPCVVLTGAGVSTESGIPGFRSATGIWREFDPYEVASIEAFHRDPERVGTSLEVWPVAGLPEETLAHGGKLAIVNREPTPFDDRADCAIRATAGETLASCLQKITTSSS